RHRHHGDGDRNGAGRMDVRLDLRSDRFVSRRLPEWPCVEPAQSRHRVLAAAGGSCASSDGMSQASVLMTAMPGSDEQSQSCNSIFAAFMTLSHLDVSLSTYLPISSGEECSTSMPASLSFFFRSASLTALA